MSKELIIIGDILMVTLSMLSLISSIALTIKIFKSDEYRDRKFTKKLNTSLNNLTYLLLNKGVIVPKKFIYGHRNTGDSPCALKELIIDDSYLNQNSNVLIKKGEF